MTGHEALLRRLAELARDVGHLGRRVDPGSSAYFLTKRIADEVETLDAMVYPSAAELRRAFFLVCGDDELATEEALRVVDDRARLLRTLLRREANR